VVSASLVATVALERVGSALAWENDHPIDPDFSSANCSTCIPGPPGVARRGPDAVRDGVSVVLGPELSVDGAAVPSADALFHYLRRKRELWQQLQPGESFPGAVVVNPGATTRVGELEQGLLACWRAGYPNVQLLLSELDDQTRPLLGRVRGRRDSALSLQLARQAGACSPQSEAPIRLAAAVGRPFNEWLSELLAARRAAFSPCLLLPPWHCPAGPSSCRDAADAGFRLIRQTTLGRQIEAVRLEHARSQYLVAFVPKTAAVDVLSLNGGDHDPAGDFAALAQRYEQRQRRVVWAMNAGMYHADRGPVGLLVSEGVELSPLNHEDGEGNFFLKPNGVFAITRDGPVAESSEIWSTGYLSTPRAATQSGPLLLEEGRYHPALKPDSTHRAVRNAVGVIRDSDTAVFAISTAPVTFHEIATLLSSLGCDDALYLDGNVSSLFAPALERRDSGAHLGPVIVVSEAR
jgi:uncharacterized protein YigE (DUF2233 family)